MADLIAGNRRRHADRSVAEDQRHEADQEQTQAPRRQHDVDHASIKETHDQPLHDQPDDADHDRGDHQHGEVDVDAGLGRGDGRVTAEHHELAVRQVDDAHHPKHDRQSRADQGEKGDHVEDLKNDDRRVIHSTGPLATTGRSLGRSLERSTTFSEKRQPLFPDHALVFRWSMFFPENRYPLFRIMLSLRS